MKDLRSSINKNAVVPHSRTFSSTNTNVSKKLKFATIPFKLFPLNDSIFSTYRIQSTICHDNDKIPSPIRSINFFPLTHCGRKNYTRVDEETFAKQNDYPTSDWPIKSNRAITLRAYRDRIRLNTTRECHSRDNKMDTSHVTSLGSEGMQEPDPLRPILSPSVNVLKQSALFAAISSISISRRLSLSLSRSSPRATIVRSGVRGCFDGGQPEVNLRFTRQYPPLTSTSSSTLQSCDGGWYRGALEKGERKKERKKRLSSSWLRWASAHIILINKSYKRTTDARSIYKRNHLSLGGKGERREAVFRIWQQ